MSHPALALISNSEMHNEFHVARACSLERYAHVETGLVNVFAHLMDAPLDVAGVPFFKINNARARLAIIERLLKKKYGGKYNLFWNSLSKLLGTIDGVRNNVVHWQTQMDIGFEMRDGLPPTTINRMKLVPPNYWDTNPNTPELFLNDLYDFMCQCDFFNRLLVLFHHSIHGMDGTPQAWHEICLQPVVYPPPSTHPLFRK